MRWVFPSAANASLRQVTAPTPFLAAVLAARGGLSPEDEPDQFFDPRLARLGDPFDLPDMHRAVDRLLASIDRQERVVLYGDYDVDGIASLAVLADVLAAYGLETACFLPHRMDEGYGLSVDGLNRCMAEHRPDLLVAVDCGTTSHGQIARAAANGVDVIVIDHHACDGPPPACEAVVNPMRDGRLTYLCTAGLTFKVAHALMKARRIESLDLRDCLDLVAIGTVADLVPLVGENRILVRAGLPRISTSRRPGLRALLDVSGLTDTPLTSRDVGYRIGPRLNASGRLASAVESLNLLQTRDPAAAARLARNLDTHNRERQSVERAIQTAAEREIIERHPHGVLPAGLVLGRRDWHPGVVGIVASRLMRRHHRPTVVIGFDESGVGKGSGRGIDGISLVDALRHCSNHLIQFGGHSKAAGLRIAEGSLDSFAEAFRAYCTRELDSEALEPRLTIDAIVRPSDVSESLLGEHDLLEPFGIGNPQPVLVLRAVSPDGPPRVLKEKHLSLAFRFQRTRLAAIFFQGATHSLPRPPWDVAFTLERNTFRGVTSPQMHILAIRAV